MILLLVVLPYLIQLWRENPISTTIGAGVIITAIIFFFNYRKQKRIQNLRQQVARKEQDRRAQFKNLETTCKLTDKSTKILELDFTNLIANLQKRKLTAKEVLSAFIAKSLEATAFCNAITEFNPKALKMAEELDAMSEVKGPLHGVPFCVKDDLDLEGMDSTLGLAKNCYKPKSKDAALIQTLVALGAIPFCKTNVPQTLLSYAGDNPVYGTTTSAHNKKLAPGGSSSGLGALLGSGGCFFGVGSDTGGSLRMPAHFNGVSSLKVTSGRLSINGLTALLPNLVGLEATTGIMGRDAHVVAQVNKLILENNFHYQFDPEVTPIPWDEKIFASRDKLRIGYFTQLPFFPPIGDTVATVEKAVEALKSNGHQLISMDTLPSLPDGAKIMQISGNYFFADKYRQFNKSMQDEETAESVKLTKLAGKIPMWILKMSGLLMKQNLIKKLGFQFYSKRLASMAGVGSTCSASLWENKEEQRKLIEQVLKEWRQLNLDVVLCPVMPFPAVPLDIPGQVPVGVVYTMLWSLLDFPAGVLKFGIESGQNIGNYDTQGDNILRIGKEACKESIGSPIDLQVAGLPYKEELVLRVMNELENFTRDK